MSIFKRQWDDTIGYIYQTATPPKELDEDPRLFDGIARVLDEKKFFDDDPLTSGVLTKFTVVSGELTEKYHWAEFRVTGLGRRFRKGKEPQYFIRVRKVDGWYEEDNTMPIEVLAEERQKADPDPEPEPERRRPGRPPKAKQEEVVPR